MFCSDGNKCHRNFSAYEFDRKDAEADDLFYATFICVAGNHESSWHDMIILPYLEISSVQHNERILCL